MTFFSHDSPYNPVPADRPLAPASPSIPANDNQSQQQQQHPNAPDQSPADHAAAFLLGPALTDAITAFVDKALFDALLPPSKPVSPKPRTFVYALGAIGQERQGGGHQQTPREKMTLPASRLLPLGPRRSAPAAATAAVQDRHQRRERGQNSGKTVRFADEVDPPLRIEREEEKKQQPQLRVAQKWGWERNAEGKMVAKRRDRDGGEEVMRESSGDEQVSPSAWGRS